MTAEDTQVNPRTEAVAIGIDVGSTTVKAVVVDPITKEILWSDYQRHQTKQPENVLAVPRAHRAPRSRTSRTEKVRIFITGSGAAPLAPHSARKFVQEVNAVTLAVETLHPDVGSVIELGGQDAKIIIFKKNEETGDKTAHHLDERQVRVGHRRHDRQVRPQGRPAAEEVVDDSRFDDSKLHHVAAKCGVFAETDIVNLVKSGIPSTEII